MPLLITEGEKKALKANQDGLAVRRGRRALELADRAAGRSPTSTASTGYERETVIVPDSDVWTRPDLLQPVFALGKELEARGAKVAVLKLPAARGAKVGLDDYLCAHSREALEALPRLALKHAGPRPDERLVARVGEAEGGGRRRGRRGDGARSARAGRVCPRAPSRRRTSWTACCGTACRSTARCVAITSARQAYRADRLPEGIALRHTDPGRRP